MPKTSKILAVDYGDVRTGLAVSDELGFMANGIGTVKAKGMHELASIIESKANELGCKIILIGDPVNMDGSRGQRSEKARLLADTVRQSGLEVILYDERCTTMEAYRYLDTTKTYGKKRKDVIDTLSAQIILQNYLDYISGK